MKQILKPALALCVLIHLPCPSSAVPAPDWGVSLLTLGSSPEALDEQSAVRNNLELMGIPYHETSEVMDATRHQLVIIGGLPSNTQLTPDAQEALYSYVERGGTLLASQVQGNRLFPLFGLEGARTSRSNFRMHFTATDEPALRYLNRSQEQMISLGDPDLYSETVWSTEYEPHPGTEVLARYENGAAAATRNTYGRGLAYALGLGFKETTIIPQIARSFEAARHWINWFEPSGDVFRLIVRGLYEDTVHPFLMVHTVPDGKRTALCLSHDVDARESFEHSLAFARMEAELGVRSTFFVTTKYFLDAADIGYYTPDRVEWIRQVARMGFEVSSHSVSHSIAFDRFPLGVRETTQADYDVTQPTLFGEIRVSKELLDRDLEQETRGFRAGYLRYPHQLLSALEDSEYTYDSSVSAQATLTNFPHFGFRRREVGSELSTIVVVPVALDDSRGELVDREFLRADNQDEVLAVWSEVIEANAENNAISCLLIHPTDVTYKLETERRLIERHQGPDTWIGDVGSLARFWSDRDRLRPLLESRANLRPVVTLNVTRADLPPRQTLVVERQEGLPPPQIFDAAGNLVTPEVREQGDRFFLILP